jgi:uncharacterized membrane protein
MIRRMAAALVSLAGVFVSAYLWLYKLGKIGTLACGTGGCETVQLSPYARFLGVDVALIGLIGYLMLLVLTLISLDPRRADAPGPLRLAAWFSGAGVAFALYLTYLELFVIHAICRWCAGSAVLITLYFVLVLLERRRGRPATR